MACTQKGKLEVGDSRWLALYTLESFVCRFSSWKSSFLGKGKNFFLERKSITLLCSFLLK